MTSVWPLYVSKLNLSDGNQDRLNVNGTRHAHVQYRAFSSQNNIRVGVEAGHNTQRTRVHRVVDDETARTAIRPIILYN